MYVELVDSLFDDYVKKNDGQMIEMKFCSQIEFAALLTNSSTLLSPAAASNQQHLAIIIN
jgi:hypothetical protein